MLRAGSLLAAALAIPLTVDAIVVRKTFPAGPQH
jgi:hypothetical protein